MYIQAVHELRQPTFAVKLSAYKFGFSRKTVHHFKA